MITFIKLIGSIIMIFGLMLLFSAYDMTTLNNLETFTLCFIGLLLLIVGAVCWLWYEPYNLKEEDHEKR